MKEILLVTSHKVRNPNISLQGLLDLTTTHQDIHQPG